PRRRARDRAGDTVPGTRVAGGSPARPGRGRRRSHGRGARGGRRRAGDDRAPRRARAGAGAAPDLPRLGARAGGAGRGRAPALGVSSIRRVRVGISSWADPALIESRGFYPKNSMSCDARLRFEPSVFDVVEVNASYYAIPDVLTVRRWDERTTPGFVFIVKAWTLMTGLHPGTTSTP